MAEPEKKYKVKMLWHMDFWDYPRDGLAEINGEKVYFKVENEPDPINVYELPKEYQDQLHQVTYDYLTKLSQYLPDDFNDEDIGEYKEYTVYRYDKFVFKKKLSYKIYRMPSHILEQYEAVQKDFNENVGYHNHHDPLTFKQYVSCVNEDYWKKKKEPIEGFDVKNFECLGSFYWDEFEYFQRPWIQPAQAQSAQTKPNNE